jgi:hypothetical protein
MGTLSIALFLIPVAALYKPFLTVSKLRSTLQIAILYIVSAFALAFAGLYVTYESASHGEVVVFVLCMIGAIVRVGYTHFKLGQQAAKM